MLLMEEEEEERKKEQKKTDKTLIDDRIQKFIQNKKKENSLKQKKLLYAFK